MEICWLKRLSTSRSRPKPAKTAAKKSGSEIVLAGASEPARELLHLLDLETLWALYDNRKEAIAALSSAA